VIRFGACTAVTLVLALVPSVAHAQAEVATPVGGGASVMRPAASVELHAKDPGLTFHIRSGEAEVHARGVTQRVDVFSPLCVAPCRATLPLGTSRLAISTDGSSPVEASQPLYLTGPSRIDATLTSRADVRYVGVGLVMASVVVGAALLVASSQSGTERHCVAPNDCVDSPTSDETMRWTGIAIAGVGSLIGIVLMKQTDSVAMDVVPLRLDAPTLGARREGGMHALDGNGLALRLRF
jgi:hypothetical protein